MTTNLISHDVSEQTSLSSLSSSSKEVLVLNQVPNQLHSAQQEINNLRLLNVCLQSTLLRIQSQLSEHLPLNAHDEIKRNNTKQKLAALRQTDDHSRRVIHQQQISFFQMLDHFSTFFDMKQEEQRNLKKVPCRKTKNKLRSFMKCFYELNTIIHTEHNDRICQLYITLAQTSHSNTSTKYSASVKRQKLFGFTQMFLLVLDQTIHAHRIISKRRMKRKIFFTLIIIIFISIVIFIIILSIRIH